MSECREAVGAGERPDRAGVTEGVRATIAAYTHALDDGRTDDVLDTYCTDGTFEFPAAGTFTGREELSGAYAGWVPRVPQRHLVANTLVTEWSDREATAVSDVVLLVQGADGWATQFVARYRDVLHHDGERWRFHHRVVAAAV